VPVILTVTVATAGGWLLLWVWLVFRTSPVPAAEGPPWLAGPAGPAGPESPAVVSLLAGRLQAFGYQATLLDLAARGWFRVEAPPGGPVMCVLGGNPPRGELASYERRAYAHLVTRAGGRRDVPARALADGFVGEAGPGGLVKSAKAGFMEGFARDVTEDSRQRGLSRPRVSSPAGCLLFLAALVPAIASALAVHAFRSNDYWIPVACFFGLCALLGLSDGEQPTRAGRAALREWRARCAAPAVASAAMTPAGGGVGIMPPGWPQREVAYAAAIGKASAAVGLFTDEHGQQRGKTIWSSYGGSWRQVAIGDPARRSWVQAGGCGMQIVVILLLALLPPTVATIILAHGELRAAALGVIALDALLVMLLLGKDAAVPGFAEFDGQVVEAWTQEESDENTTTSLLCLAIDDGVRDQAWAFSVTQEQYARFIPGTLVHARVNPRRNKLLEMWPLSASR
jgi:hypothetical protein